MHPKTEQRKLILFGGLVAILPVLVVTITGTELSRRIVQADLYSQISENMQLRNFAPCIVIVLAAAVLCLLAIKRGIGTLSLIVVGLMALPMIGAATSSLVPHSLFIDFDNLPGTKLWCNDVYLGETPLRMTTSEFHAKVAPISTPPDQPRVVVRRDGPEGWRFPQAQWSLLPGDPTTSHSGRTWPFVNAGYSGIMAVMRSGRYWWRLEHSGYTACSRGAYFSPQVQNGSRMFNFPQVQYPSQSEHSRLLQLLLAEDESQPTPEFLAHVEKFGPKLKESLKPHLSGDIDDSSGYRVSPQMSESEVEVVFQSLVRRTAETGMFRTPSAESAALAAIAKQHPEVIRSGLRDLDGVGYRFQASRSTSDIHDLHIGNPDVSDAGLAHARRVLISIAVTRERTIDDSSFEDAVFRQNWSLIALSDRPESIPLILQHLHEEKNRFSGSHGMAFLGRHLEVAMQSNLPEIQDAVRECLRDAREHDSRYIHHFIDRQLELNADPVEVADWVERSTPLDKDDRLKAFLKIGPTDFTERIRRAQLEPQKDHNSNMEVWENAKPVAIQYLIDRASTAPFYRLVGLLCFHSDRPEVKEFLQERLSNTDFLQMAADGLRYKRPYATRMAWLVDPLIDELQDETLSDKRRHAIMKFLSTEPSDRAWQTFVASAGENKSFLRIIKRHEDDREARRQELAADLALARDLVAGRLHPDDLLDADVYTWKEYGYELVESE